MLGPRKSVASEGSMCLGFIDRDPETKGERERETEIYREG